MTYILDYGRQNWQKAAGAQKDWVPRWRCRFFLPPNLSSNKVAAGLIMAPGPPSSGYRPMTDHKEKELTSALSDCVLESSWLCTVVAVALAVPLGVRQKVSGAPALHSRLAATAAAAAANRLMYPDCRATCL